MSAIAPYFSIQEKIDNTFKGSWNEWDDLEEVIIGTIEEAVMPLQELYFRLGLLPESSFDSIQIKDFPDWMIKETQEDLEEFSSSLQKLGIKVRRPTTIDNRNLFSNPYWTSSGFYNYCPRDIPLVVGNKIIECPSPMRSRYFETFPLQKIFNEYMHQGAALIAAPKPQLTDDLYDYSNPLHPVLRELEPAFDAANVIRAGRHIFYLVSFSGNLTGAIWLQNILGSEFKVIPLEGLYNGTHIDSTITFLREGLVLLNPERISHNDLPEELRKWDHIYADVIDVPPSWNYSLSSKWIGMNLLVLNPNLVVVEERQTNLMRQLEQHKFDILPVRLRHSRDLGGGAHCISLDVKRKGVLEDYFS